MKKVFLFIIIYAVLLTGCLGEKDAAIPNGKPVIGVTLVPQKTFVKEVCKELADVVVAIPPGYSPESYDITPAQRKKLGSVSVYFSIGVAAEEASIFPYLGNVKITELDKEAASVYPERKFEDGERDPHIWLSLKRVSVMVDAIAREMGILDGANKEKYYENARLYKEKLKAAETEIAEALSNVKNKSFITYHPAFGYFADDFGLEMHALEKSGKEATGQHLGNMIDFAKANNIKVIFYQRESGNRQALSFAEEIGGKAIELEPLAENYIENLIKTAHIISEVSE